MTIAGTRPKFASRLAPSVSPPSLARSGPTVEDTRLVGRQAQDGTSAERREEDRHRDKDRNESKNRLNASANPSGRLMNGWSKVEDVLGRVDGLGKVEEERARVERAWEKFEGSPDKFEATREKIRVTYVLGSLRDGGAERYALQIMQKLDRSRFCPSLVLMEGINLQRSEGWVSERFVMDIPQGGNARWLGRSLRLARAVQATAARFREWNSDVVHAFLSGPSILGGAAAKLAKVPVMIGSRHSLLTHYSPRRGLAALADRAAFHLADLSLAPSEAVAEEMFRLGGCPRAKCQTLYNGVDTERFHPALARNWRAHMGWKDEHVVFGMIANFRPCKGHADFVAAAALIAERHRQARFLMVGANQGLMPEIRQQVRELGLTEKTVILSADPEPEKIMAALDVFVCASTSEAFGIAIAEAMACGRAVIATDVGGIPELVDDGNTGILVPARAPQAIAAAATILFDRERRAQMGGRGRERVVNLFSLDRAVAAHEKLYVKLMEDRFPSWP